MEATQLGAYRIERTLGRGGFGVVYEAVDTRLGRRVALKQLLPQFSQQREFVERFFAEARATAALDHPGIVDIYDVGWHSDGSAYFVMKLLEGESLGQRLRKRGQLSVAVAATLARQIANAVGAAHARGIVHRDLKPENVLLVADPEIGERVVVVDFGIAKLLDDVASSLVTSAGALLGTPMYMSPEQCRGANAVDHRTDIYALGCIVFQMLAGRPPHVGESSAQIVGMHQFVEPPALRSLRPDIPVELEAIVMRALAKDPGARIALEGFARSLEPFTRSIDPLAATVDSTPPAPRSATVDSTPPAPRGGATVASISAPPVAAKSRRPLIIAGAGVLVAGGVAIAVVMSSSKPKPKPKPPAPLAVGSVEQRPPPATPDAALVIPREKAEQRELCRQLVAARRWNDLIPCAQTLRIGDDTADVAAHEAYMKLAVLERNAETSYQALTDDLAKDILKNAPFLLTKRIPAASVYYPEALDAYRRGEARIIAAAIATLEPTTGDCPALTTKLVAFAKTQGEMAADSVRARLQCKAPCDVCTDAKPYEDCMQGFEHDRDLGTQLMLHGAYADAVRIFEAALSCRPGNEVFLVKLVGAACRAKQTTLVMRYFAKLSVVAQIDVGRICTDTGITPR